MKLSRLLGAAVTWGTLFGGSLVQAQVNYYPSSNGTYPLAAQAPVAPPTYYPTTYPSTSGYRYDVASLPTGPIQFAGPSNAPVTRLPASGTPTLVGHAPTAGMHGLESAPAVGSVLVPSTPNYQMLTQNHLPAQPPAPITPYSSAGNDYPALNGSAGYGGKMSTGGLQPFAGPDSSCAASSSCATSSACCTTPNCWYGGLYGMILTRDQSEHYTFSYDTAVESIQYTDAKDANINWGGGFAAVAGHYFNCGCNAIEGVYWGWYPETASTTMLGANAIGGLSGIFNWDSLTYNGVNMGVGFVDNAAIHSLSRENEAHNIELNLLSFSGTNSGSLFRYTMLAGVRYFRFRDQLTFRSDPNDTVFTGEVDEVYYDIETINNLVGFQVGGVGTFCVGPRLSLNTGLKVGLYGNQINHSSQIGGAAGIAVINNGPNTGLAFDVNNSKNDVAFLSEIFVGAGYSLTNRWSLSGGYRAIAVTGLASPTDQIYPDLRGINDLYTVESPSSLILHGAYFGAQYCF